MERKTRELLPMQVFPAQVKKVAEEERTCTVRVNDNVDFFDVKLYAVTDKSLKGFCLIPAIDSTVLVARIANGNDLYVCSFSEVEKVLGTIGDKVEFCLEEEQLHYKNDQTDVTVKSNDIQVKTENVTFTVSDKQVTVKAQKVVFNDGKKGGLININDLAAYIDDIADKFNAHTHIFATGTIAVSGAVGSLSNTTPITSPAPKSTVTKVASSKYEDSTITH